VGGRTHGRTDGQKIFTQYSGISSCSLGSTYRAVEDNNSPTPPTPKKMKDIYVNIHSATETMYSNQTGQFPATSSSGNQYIMVLVEVDGNYIDAEPMKNRSAGSMIKAYLALWAQLMATGVIQPTTHLMDNEA
jgi:hypothetical protein